MTFLCERWTEERFARISGSCFRAASMSVSAPSSVRVEIDYSLTLFHVEARQHHCRDER